MRNFIPDKVENIKPYGFEDASGCRVKLDANESFVSLPDRLRKRLSEITQGLDYNRYPDPLAMKAVAAYSGYIGIPSDYITAGNGSDELISVIINTLLNRGDKLLLCAPDFSMYRFYAGLAEVGIVNVQKKDDFSLDTPGLLAQIGEKKPGAVILSNPCSPTGLALKRDEMLALILGTDTLWIVDEAYMDFWDQSISDTAPERDNLIVLRTCSKAFGLAGLRLGFAICNKKLTEALRKAKSPANVNALTCEMAAAVISDPEFSRASISAIKKSSAELRRGITALQERHAGRFRACPATANFSYIVPEKSGDAGALWEFLKAKGILIRNLGSALRVTAGTPEENRLFLDAFREWLEG